MQMGRDASQFLGSSPGALCRVDEHGWLALSGEACADLNMAAVARSAPASVLDRYIDEIEGRHLDAILIVDPDALYVVEAARTRGLTSAGELPMILWEETSPLDDAAPHLARQADETDLSAVNSALAEAFSLDEAAVQRAIPRSIVSRGADVWIVDVGGTVAGSGIFIRSGDHVGIYCMATRPRFQKQGIGRAVLGTAMRFYLDHGVTTFTLEATAAGVRLYEQVGFRAAAHASVFVIGRSTQF